MAERERLICASAELVERENGVPLSLPEYGPNVGGFVVRFNGVAHGYVNRCAHAPVPLDWQEGNFFDLTRRYLICSTHGAHYEPTTGYCVLGPCKGRALQKLNVVEHDGNIYLVELEVTS